ncbi:MAG: universal stress protein [Proteobacteria bacterium]|nr:universal stress protein [Pseudomonadota bacterium]
MNKHLLVTISSDADNLFGVRFVCSFFNDLSEHLVTLLHICRLDCDNMTKSLTEMWQTPEEKTGCELTGGPKRSLDKAQELLGRENFSIDRTITKTAVERYGKVKDILTEGSQGYYDAIVLGRRASYTLQWMFERPAEEVAQTMIRDSCCDVPLWICPESETGRKNVLVGVDGSDNSCRAVDHVGFILSSESRHSITLFHVNNGISRESTEIFARAEKILHGHNIGDERIRLYSTWGISVAGAIQSEGEKGGYSAVALGMHGSQEKGLLKDYILAGGTTAKLINKIEKTALWCCP